MGIERFYVHDVTILTAAVEEGRYGEEADWANPAERTVKGWVSAGYAQHNATADPSRDVDSSRWAALLPLAAELRDDERIRCHGRLFDVDGHVLTGRTPEGDHHLEAPLKLVEG